MGLESAAAGGNDRSLHPPQPAIDPPARPRGALLLALALTAATTTSPRPAGALPRDASHQACIERLLRQPGAKAELAAMVCGSQPDPDPAASAAEQRRRRLSQEAQQAFDQQQDALFHAWLLRHPGGNRRQWQESLQAEQDRRRQEFAEQQQQRRLEQERLEQAYRAADDQRRQEQARLDWQCWLERARRPQLIIGGKERSYTGLYRDLYLSQQCIGRPVTGFPAGWILEQITAPDP